MRERSSVELPYAERDLPSDEDVEQEVMGRIERDLIQLHAITDAHFSLRPDLFLVDSVPRADIAAQFARYFHRESPWDFPPYTKGDESEDLPVWLIRSQRVRGSVPLAAGAVGMRRYGDGWALKWIWIHPWERGKLVRHNPTPDVVFDLLDELYGEFRVEGPVTAAMRGLMTRRKYGPDRVI
ncbi:hypothetical protein ACEXQD_13980 [Herbiconiux sp. P15]|uniref:hypothetical protein n=1 Tax=Herbiconiux liukaitaii TaxID=3342799 RepID=UPI0035B82E10